jgi:hypothetical protein
MKLCVHFSEGYVSVYPECTLPDLSAYIRLYVYDGGVHCHGCRFGIFDGSGFVDPLRQGDYDAYASDGMSDCEIERMDRLVNATAALVFDPNESAECNAFAITEALREIFREEI